MTPYWQASDVTLHHGDARTIWQHLPEQSVHAIVTSPPYYGLRDYGVDGQLGLEPSPIAYVETLADLLTLWGTSVLRGDGSLWLNLGDSYSSGGRGTYDSDDRLAARGHGARPASELPGKCLLMIPERVALALIGRGWILRNKVVWAKPNGMPSSATDRLATKHEALFHFVRQPRYVYDLDAIREPRSPHTAKYYRDRQGKRYTGYNADLQRANSGGLQEFKSVPEAGANPGDVWTIPTQPYPQAHFAVYPPELCRRPILATVPEWACRACGAGRQRITERGESDYARMKGERDWRDLQDAQEQRGASQGGRTGKNTLTERGTVPSLKAAPSITVGWSDCGCNAGFTAGTVADPFAGAGTTAVMARRLGRRSLLVELNADYCQLIARRLAQDVLTL
jgi:DNA modification methylase